VKIFQDNGAVSPQAEFWSGIFLLAVLMLNDADELIVSGPPPWYVWPMGLAWLAVSIWLICHGRRRLRERK
jgi:amino acid transporter